MNDLYSVISSGEIHSDYNLPQVQASFAKLFKLTPEKAGVFIGRRRVVKKGLEIKSANAYKQKLEAIGLIVELKRDEPIIAASSLTLEPTEEELVAADDVNTVLSNTITCPKCNLEQAKAEQCTGCGVYMHKVQHMMADTVSHIDAASSADDENNEDGFDDDYEDEGSEAFNYKPIAAAAVAAVVGAFLWKFITLISGYEVGIIAWGIGGMVGFAAAAFGSRAPAIGIVCGVFALLAILAGKYMAIEAIQADWMEELTTLSEEDRSDFQFEYNALLMLSNVYVGSVTDDESRLQFVLDYYSEAETAALVTAEEIMDFKENIEPSLKDFAYNKPSFEQWIKQWVESMQDEMDNMSTMSLVKEDLDWMDLLFFFLGISTAFRLGSGRR